MKRTGKLFLLCCLICSSLSVSAFASSIDTYELDELGMSIDIPNGYITFTRDIDANDPNLSAYGLTKESLSSLMSDQNIYLNAWDEDINYEIIVTMISSPLEDFNQFSDSSLSALASSMATEYENVGITYIKSQVYQHSQAKFLKIYISQPNNGDTAYGLQYYTVYAGKAINVTMQSYSGNINSSKETILKGLVDSVRFDTDPIVAEKPAATASFTYTDDNSGVTFTVPANWVEAPMNEERDYIDAKFTSNLEEGLTIFFTSEDVWNELTETEKRQFSRGDIDNSIFTKADIAEMCGGKEKDVSMTTYAGKEYYCAEVITTGTVYGLTVSVPTTFLVRCENGYMFMFQFFGESDSKYYDDFKALMNSVDYPKLSNSDSGNDLWGRFSLGNILVSLAITIAVYSLPIIIYRYVIRKEPVDNKKAKRIIIIYGVIAFIVMSVIVFTVNSGGAAGGAILLWSWVNYRVLIGGTKKSIDLPQAMDTHTDMPKPDDFQDIPQISANVGDQSDGCKLEAKEVAEQAVLEKSVTCERKEISQPTIAFCHRCGNRLTADSMFCNKCGTKIPDGNRGEV